MISLHLNQTTFLIALGPPTINPLDPPLLYPLLNARAALPEYEAQKGACQGKRVLIVGGGPVGLRSAIEAALLGAEVDVVEKRTQFSRNNCLHLWPFVVTDLRNIGAKIFYSKFATGGIDHISKFDSEFCVYNSA